MPLVCGVRFRGTGKVYHFSPGDLSIDNEDWVIVSTARGDELGRVSLPPHEVADTDVVGELKPVLRKASESDISRAEEYYARETEVVAACQEQISRSGLEMKVVSAEYAYDGSRLTFFFTAENRVDFRALVRDLARTFKTRIDLRQIGVRDEAKLVGGLGPCGRPLCCATWLTQFSPVSIRMAKQQNLPLSPMEISGLCGRLLCCLTYENDYYQQVRGLFPKVGRTVDTPYGPAKVLKVSVLRETVTLLLEDGSTTDMTADQLSGAEPLAPRDQRVESGALASTLQRTAERGGRRPPSQQQGRPTAGQPRGRDGRDQSAGSGRGPSGGSRRSSGSRDASDGRPAPQTRPGPPPDEAKAPGGDGSAPAGGSRRSRGRSGRRRRGSRRPQQPAPSEG
ncbi:MAG: stage 0 sporulation family protein [Chloroflexi bacterium]|nr:stage 0 sporulation family protein [Chloroflexota bacterium]